MSHLTVDGCEVYYVVSGPRSAPAVALTHGALLDHRSWATQIEALAPDYRVLAWDLPGHGRSKPLRSFSTPSAARALLALMDREDIAQAALVGLSVGGYIAQRVAYDQPERVRALACLGTTPLTATELPAIARYGFRNSAAIMRGVPYGLFRRAFPLLMARSREVQSYALEASNRVERSEFLTFWSGVSQSLEDDPLYTYPLPLLIGFGESDIVGGVRKLSRRWAERCPHAELHVIPSASHLANQDNPKATNRILRQFLSRADVWGHPPLRMHR